MILQYYDVMLYEEDVFFLSDDQWLNDTCIEFYMEYLERTKLLSIRGSSVLQVFLLRPAITFLITNSPDKSDLSSAIPAQLTVSDVIFMPVKFVLYVDKGSPLRLRFKESDVLFLKLTKFLHLYVKSINKFLHYDSAGPMNMSYARITAKKVARRLGIKDYEVIGMHSPQQKNGSDCGVYVVAITDHLTQRLLNINPETFSPLTDLILAPNDIPAASFTRKMMRSLVANLVKKSRVYE
ncbi:9148_t:CDS:2 [Paraglomus occultum]|uniref:9148_t:CDS:1 n=1 Tax=Paraglomus occultum TaxID=144539 RepID=A0A9N9ALF9_9GLOM|nr:9148_t:CDS:2 [Paraglomus occultum]